MREKFCQVSYTRQLERGMSRPGYVGRTVERSGDAEVFQPLPAVTKEDIQQGNEREQEQEEARSVGALSAALQDAAQVTAAKETNLPISCLFKTLWPPSAEVEEINSCIPKRLVAFVIYVRAIEHHYLCTSN